MNHASSILKKVGVITKCQMSRGIAASTFAGLSETRPLTGPHVMKWSAISHGQRVMARAAAQPMREHFEAGRLLAAAAAGKIDTARFILRRAVR